MNRVVPVTVKIVVGEAQRIHVGVGYFDAEGIHAGIELRLDGEAGARADTFATALQVPVIMVPFGMVIVKVAVVPLMVPDTVIVPPFIMPPPV